MQGNPLAVDLEMETSFSFEIEPLRPLNGNRHDDWTFTDLDGYKCAT